MKNLKQLLLILCIAINTINISTSDDQELQRKLTASQKSAFYVTKKQYDKDSDDDSSRHSSKVTTPTGSPIIALKINDEEGFTTPRESPITAKSHDDNQDEEEEIQETEEERTERQRQALEEIEAKQKDDSVRLIQKIGRGYNSRKSAEKEKQALFAAEAKRVLLQKELTELQQKEKEDQQKAIFIKRSKEIKAEKDQQKTTDTNNSDSRDSSDSDYDTDIRKRRRDHFQKLTKEERDQETITMLSTFSVACAVTCFTNPLLGVASTMVTPSLITLGYQTKDWFAECQNSDKPFDVQIKKFLDKQGDQWYQWYVENQKYGLSFFDYDHMQKALTLQKDQWASWIQKQHKE